jgi:hypothetical protein
MLIAVKFYGRTSSVITISVAKSLSFAISDVEQAFFGPLRYKRRA